MTLIDKLRAADGPDRELFYEVINKLDVRYLICNDNLTWQEEVFVKRLRGFIDANAWIDAALALVADVLPESSWLMDGGKNGDNEFSLYPNELIDPHKSYTEQHPALCHAILIALLTALEGESA